MSGAPPAFEFPEYYSFPPMFTLQPVEETRAKQLGMWVELVLAFQRHHRRSSVRVAEAARAAPFANDAIGRALGEEGVRAVLDELERRGHGKWRGGSRAEFLTSYKTFEAWADLVLAWARNCGKEGTICTLYELHSGDEAEGEEFHGLDSGVLLEAVRVLEERGAAVLVHGSSEDETGVKFLRR